jgi:hypothetical protein
MRKLLIFLALFGQSKVANGQTLTSADEGCVRVSETFVLCLTENGRKTWSVAGSGDQLAFLPDPSVRVEVKTMPYDPEWGLNEDEIAARIASGITREAGERLTTWGNQGSVQDWGHVITQDFEIASADGECSQLVTYQYIGDASMLLISSYFCGASRKSFSEIEHNELLGSIWTRRDH